MHETDDGRPSRMRTEYALGTGTWRVVSGTGNYAGWKGGGRFVYLDDVVRANYTKYRARFEGYITP